jgi:hypothetical protein
LILLARPKRFELLTPRFVVWCSVTLVSTGTEIISAIVRPPRSWTAGALSYARYPAGGELGLGHASIRFNEIFSVESA